MQPKPFVICLMGPTAAGKTDLALALADHFSCEIVSVDSALVYKEMNIGTAKPDRATLTKAPHHLIDIRDAAVPYSAAEFVTDANKLIQEIHARGRLPLLVGGTMLYYRALTQGMAELPSADEDIRNKIQQQAKVLGWPELHNQLLKIDAIAAEKIHPNDAQRIARALEVYEVTGEPMSVLWQAEQDKGLSFNPLYYAISPKQRSTLHDRIAIRFQKMLEQGFVEEVEQFYQREDMNLQLPSMRAVGYRQVWKYFDGEWDYGTMRDKAIVATRQLAKRQLTWLRTWPGVQHLQSDDEDLQQTITVNIENRIKHD